MQISFINLLSSINLIILMNKVVLNSPDRQPGSNVQYIAPLDLTIYAKLILPTTHLI